ncbi:MAG: response regulator, partial [Proteobacteria bacterium]|nr:response regulator [Pseudomonadota bacterium]
NPLAPISTAARVLRMRGSSDPDVAQASAIIARQVEHMVTLVDDLLDVSRFTRGLIELQMECLDINAVVAQAVEQVRPLIEARSHALASSVADGSVDVRGDRTRLIQVVANLLNNAAKYTPPGGRIELRVETGDAHVCIVVVDNGIGIDATLLPNVFDLFSQGTRTPDRSQGGLGIGLALSLRLARMHKGTLKAHSDGVGKGSRFTVRLPLVEAPVEEPATLPAPAKLEQTRILVVDDNHDAGDSLGQILGMLGADVRVVRDGAEALEVFPAYRPEVVLLDIGMPGMNGYEVARTLRSRHPGNPARLVALTGWGQEEDRRRAVEAGFDLHLLKPADIGALQQLLSSLDTPSPGAPAAAAHARDQRQAENP